MSDKKFRVYKSSAGSGKTFTLVKEYLKYCLQQERPSYFSRILAITFTNKASSEMKFRLIETLGKAKDEKSVQDSSLLKAVWEELGIDIDLFIKRAHELLREILHSYGDLSVSTIDKFMLKVIKSFARDLKLPINFEIDMQQAQLLERAISQLLDGIGEDPATDRLLFDYSKWKISEGKSWKIDDDLHKSAMNLYEEGGKDQFANINHFTQNEYIELIDAYKRSNAIFEDQLLTLAKEAKELILKSGLEVDDFVSKKGGFAGYLFKVAEGTIEPPGKNPIKAAEAEKLYANKSPKQAEIESVTPQLIDWFYQMVQIFHSDYGGYLSRKEFVANLPAQALLGKINSLLESRKKEENLINISDFNSLISEIVMNDLVPFIYERIGERYQHIMIDEFQDTSVLQFQNLLPLIDESLSKGKENLIVGDAKQSIYRFRGAQVEQFTEMPDIKVKEFQHELNEERMRSLQYNYEEKELNTNWRSSKEIIEFNNGFFDQLLNYDGIDERTRHIFQGHAQVVPENADSTGYVEMKLVSGQNKEEKDPLHLEQLVVYIEQLREDGYSYSDMAVLCIANDDLVEVAKYLAERAYPIISSEALKLSASSKIEFLIALLVWVYDPNSDKASIQIANYLFEEGWIKEDRTAVLQEYLGKEGKGLRQLLLDHELPIPKRKQSHEDLLQWFERQIRLFGLSKSYDPYIQFFEEFVLEVLQDNLVHEEFLKSWESEKDKRSIELSDHGDAIELMTIHKSKGLEFKAVLLPFATYTVRPTKKFLWLKGLPEPAAQMGLEVGLLKTKGALAGSSYSPEFEEEMLRSEGDLLNTVYVAFTRAVDRLYIISEPPPKTSTKISMTLLLDRLTKHMIFKEGENYAYFGKRVSKEEKKEESIQKNTFILNTYHSSSWNNKLSLSLEMKTQWEEGEVDSRSYGSLVHEILAKVRNKNELPKIIEQFYLSGKLDADTRAALLDQLSSLLGGDEIAPFFDSSIKVLNERSFVATNGDVLRPDRIIENDEELLILDYKSGEKREEDLKQLQRYQEELQKISKKKVSAFLLYLSDAELLQVA